MHVFFSVMKTAESIKRSLTVMIDIFSTSVSAKVVCCIECSRTYAALYRKSLNWLAKNLVQDIRSASQYNFNSLNSLCEASHKLFRDSKQFTGLCNCQSRDVKAMDFAFNMSLSTINIARQFGKVYGMDLSVSDVKLLLHNAAMVERIFSTFGNSPNLMKNNTDFKELL